MVLSVRKKKKLLKKHEYQPVSNVTNKEKNRKRKTKSERLQYIALIHKFSWIDELCKELEDENL